MHLNSDHTTETILSSNRLNLQGQFVSTLFWFRALCESFFLGLNCMQETTTQPFPQNVKPLLNNLSNIFLFVLLYQLFRKMNAFLLP